MVVVCVAGHGERGHLLAQCLCAVDPLQRMLVEGFDFPYPWDMWLRHWADKKERLVEFQTRTRFLSSSLPLRLQHRTVSEERLSFCCSWTFIRSSNTGSNCMWTLRQLYLASPSSWRSAWKTWLTASNNSLVTFNVLPAANSTHRMMITTLSCSWNFMPLLPQPHSCGSAARPSPSPAGRAAWRSQVRPLALPNTAFYDSSRLQPRKLESYSRYTDKIVA